MLIFIPACSGYMICILYLLSVFDSVLECIKLSIIDRKRNSVCALNLYVSYRLWFARCYNICFPFASTAGAGYHSESKAKEYKHVCKRACQKVCVNQLHCPVLGTQEISVCVYRGKREQKHLT